MQILKNLYRHLGLCRVRQYSHVIINNLLSRIFKINFSIRPYLSIGWLRWHLLRVALPSSVLGGLGGCGVSAVSTRLLLMLDSRPTVVEVRPSYHLHYSSNFLVGSWRKCLIFEFFSYRLILIRLFLWALSVFASLSFLKMLVLWLLIMKTTHLN